MTELKGRQQTRLDPAPGWTVLTDAPLKGLGLAREAGTILAWDEANQLYLLDLRGQHRCVSRAPDRVLAGAISDDGKVIALLGEGNRLWVFGPDLDALADRQGPPEASTVAIDPHGRYIAVGSRLCLTQFYTRHGRQAGRFETRQALAHIAFVPDRPFLLGAATYGMLAGLDLRPASAGRLDAELAWQEALMSNVGRLTTTGDGGMVLASCFTHGVQRYDLQGQNEGAYHLGGTVAHAVPDFAGRMFAVSTLEGELAVLSSAGNVRWKTNLPRPVIALETDPLGRYVIYGHGTGEIVRLDLYGNDRPAGDLAPAEIASAAGGRGSSVRAPEWTIPVASTDEQAASAVLAVLDEPPRIGLMTNTNRLQIFTTEGANLGQAPDILGVGRILRTSAGWIAAATDRHVVLYDARRNSAQRLDSSLVEVTHLAIRPDSYGLAVVQESDRLGRATVSGRWVWKRELKSPVEDLAIGPDGYAAVTTNDGRFLIFNPAGEPEPTANDAADPSDPRLLIEAPDGSPPRVAWLTLARRAQVLRGHDRQGRVLWESPTPWEGWELQRLGAIAVISAPDGRALAFDGSGHLRSQGRGSDTTNDLFGAGPKGEPRRISRQGVHLICADLGGRVDWRAVADAPLGPIALGRAGVAVLIGRSLAWFRA
jgi:hypothetical protein